MEDYMKVRSISVVVSLVLFSMLAGTPAIADTIDTIGVAVGEVGSTTPVRNSDGDTIDFYIPLSEDKNGIYGVNAGTSQDKCYEYGDYYGNRQCGGGLLEMILYFGGVVPGEAVISLEFTDLDLLPDMNDTLYFWESLVVAGDALGGDVLGVSVRGDSDRESQTIDVTVDVGSTGGFWLTLELGTHFDFSQTTSYKFWNTEEHLLATLSSTGHTSVPEPGTLALLGLGLVGMGASRRRVRK